MKQYYLLIIFVIVATGLRSQENVGGDMALVGFEDSSNVITAINESYIHSYHTSEGFMVTKADGSVVHFFRLDAGEKSNHARNRGQIVKRVSANNGKDWGIIQTVYNNPAYDDRNLYGALIGQDSIVMFFRTYDAEKRKSIGLNYMHSFDGGYTWSDPQIFSTRKDLNFGTHNPIFVPGKGFMMSCYSPYYLQLVYSKDGISWTDSEDYVWDYRSDSTYAISEACFAYAGEGRIIGLIRNLSTRMGATMYQVWSDDYGASFSEPKLTNITAPFYAPAPLIFYDEAHDDLWVIATDRRNLNSRALEPRYSQLWIYRDKPKNLTKKPDRFHLLSKYDRLLNTDYRLYGYPSKTQLSNGDYLVMFTDSYRKRNKLEGANFYQFTIAYKQ